ncbi:MAG TPA: hypothetical protein DCS23_03360 [Candidatus Yonathbacteria bacterium]|nr:hypothetical protein [Candidatus Yonathbacteria bacterium]
MATLTIFANFYINDEERFLRMKDSFLSFKDIEAEKWVINVRGKYKFDTLFFLHDNLGDKLIPYMLESEKGWFSDTRLMLGDINTDFVFFWIEDHLNLVDTKKYEEILKEMKDACSEYLCYSWWNSGKLIEPYSALQKREYKNISTFLLDKESLKETDIEKTYIISMAGIFLISLFNKIIKIGPPILRGYSKYCPFDFEKGGGDTSWLPIHYAIPKYELFASIDDGGEGYSLQSRGLYPKRALRPVAPLAEVPYLKFFFRTKIREYIPKFIYKKLIMIVIFYNKLSHHINLMLKGL